VQAKLGDTVSRVLMLDTGSPINMLSDETRSHLGSRVANAGKTLTPHRKVDGTPYLDSIPSWTVDRMTVRDRDHALSVQSLRFTHGSPRNEILGAPFMQQFGVVGFNFRTRQMLVYQTKQ
jgi:hypothetical protein